MKKMNHKEALEYACGIAYEVVRVWEDDNRRKPLWDELCGFCYDAGIEMCFGGTCFSIEDDVWYVSGGAD